MIRGGVLVAAVAYAGAAQSQVEYLDCNRSAAPLFCRQSQQSLREQLPNASRDYEAMRNIAYCLWTGCDGAVVHNRKWSCEIRRAIMKQYPREIGRSDDNDFSNCVRAGY